VHSHHQTFPGLGLFILIQLPVRGCMFPVRRKRTWLWGPAGTRTSQLTHVAGAITVRAGATPQANNRQMTDM